MSWHIWNVIYHFKAYEALPWHQFNCKNVLSAPCIFNLREGGNTVVSDLDEKCGVSGAGRQKGWGQVHFPPRLTLRIQPSLPVYLAGQGCLRTVYQAAVWGWLLSTDKKLITPHMYKLLTEEEVYARGCVSAPIHTHTHSLEFIPSTCNKEQNPHTYPNFTINLSQRNTVYATLYFCMSHTVVVGNRDDIVYINLRNY